MLKQAQRTEHVRRLVHGLIELLQAGRLEEANTRFYAKDAKFLDAWRQEYNTEVAGQDRDMDIGARITVHEALATTVLVDGDRAAISWRFVVSAKTGVRKHEPIPLRQLMLLWWDGDKVVREENFTG
jgi:hypothetical protein